MKFKDYYQALGVPRTATATEIKQAYRKLAHKYHPDISNDPEGEKKFKEVAEAYATLKDSEKRQQYDQLGLHAQGENVSPPPGWQQRAGTHSTFYDDIDLSDFLSAFTASRGSSRNRGFSAPGQDYEVSAPVTLEQIYHGAEIDVRVGLPQNNPYGLQQPPARNFRVRVPKGAGDGHRLRLAGKGGPGRVGGKAGDLYVVLKLAPHPLYRVSGRDLSLDLPIAPWEAALGADIRLPTLGGTVELHVKPGTTTGRRLRLPRRGLPGTDGNYGDLYATIQIEVPKTLNPRERELFERLANVSDFNPRQQLSASRAQ